MVRFLLICLAGAIGTGARYLLSLLAMRLFGADFPYGTLAVNVIGSFLVALFMFIGLESSSLPLTLRLALTVGLMGGFTTFSSFSFDTMRFFQEGALGMGLLNTALNVIGCLGASFLGWMGGRWLFSGP